MGQYYRIINIDKEEFLHPYVWDEGSKLKEFASPSYTSFIMSALALLVSDGNGQGGGDFQIENPVVGSWAYDRVVIAGDYAEPYTKVPQARPEPVWNEDTRSWGNGPLSCPNIHSIANDEYREVSMDIFLAMMEDGFLRELFKRTYIQSDTWYRSRNAFPMLATLAYAVKDIDRFPNLGNKGAWVFRTLFGDGQEYYRSINGLVKHHSKSEQYYELVNLELSRELGLS